MALLRTFIPNYNLIECFIGSWGIIVFYLLVKRLLGGTREAIFCTIILMFTPIYFFWSMFAVADITAFVIILLAVVAYLHAQETNRVSFYVVCSLLLGMTVWVKYANIILFGPFCIHYLITRKKGERLFPALAGVLVFCVCILGLLVYHKWAFGGFLTTGYSYREVQFFGKTNWATSVSERLLHLPLKHILIKMTNFPIHTAICSPITLLGIFGCFFLTRKDWKNFSLLFLISGACLFFYATVAISVAGWEEYHRSTFSSYNRYILPAYCLLIIPVSWCFQNLSLKKLTIILAVISVMNLSVLGFATINTSNLYWLLAAQQDTYQLRQTHLRLTSDNSIIIGQDVVFYMVTTPRHLIDCRADKHLQSPLFCKELTRVVHALLEDGHDVYVVQDYQEELTIENVTLELIDGETQLFKLKRAQE